MAISKKKELEDRAHARKKWLDSHAKSLATLSRRRRDLLAAYAAGGGCGSCGPTVQRFALITQSGRMGGSTCAAIPVTVWSGSMLTPGAGGMKN